MKGSRHYTIGYYPENATPDGKWRKLKVTLAGQLHGKYIVRTRSGYYAPSLEKK
jgi:hypothetical protein